MWLRAPNFLDIGDSDHPKWLAAERRIAWIALLCLYALGYYWFGWRGLLLSFLSGMASGLMGYFEARELIWKERDRILPRRDPWTGHSA